MRGQMETSSNHKNKTGKFQIVDEIRTLEGGCNSNKTDAWHHLVPPQIYRNTVAI